MHRTYSTNLLNSKDIESEWEKIISDTYYPMNIRIADKDNFYAELESWEFLDILITKLYSKGVSYNVTSSKIRNSARDYMMFTFPLNHPVNFNIEDRELISNPGTFFIEQSYSEYEVSHEHISDLMVIKVPREYIDKRVVIPQHFSAKIMNCKDGISEIFFAFWKRLCDNYDILKPNEKYTMSMTIVDFIGLMLENNRSIIESSQGSISISHMMRIEEFVKKNIADPNLSPRMVSKNCGISTSYLYKLFAKQEQSFANWLRNLRLDACRMDLINPKNHTSVSTISYRWGFIDQSYFSRIFKQKYGASPLQYKKQKLVK